MNPTQLEDLNSGYVRELFAEYLTTKNVADDAVGALFNRLYEEVTTP